MKAIKQWKPTSFPCRLSKTNFTDLVLFDLASQNLTFTSITF